QGALVRGEGLGAVAGADGARPVRTVDLAGLDPRTVALLGAAPAGLLADDPALTATVSEPERTYVALGSLDADEAAAIDRLDARRAPSIADLEALRPSADGPIEVSRRYDGGRADRLPWELIAVGLAVLLALLVISVALALSAADGRSDEQVIAAIGAPPSAVRRRRALEAALTAAGAAVLGAGVAGAATMIAIHSPALSPRVARTDIRIPFVDLSLAVVLPVVAIGGLTWLVLATGDRLRGRRDLVMVDG
ncbi:MAG TPA: FtsX-like permease family protein, partial [Iamia sp.]|nr:FtsX-like permease family protein [Iamia sp.]